MPWIDGKLVSRGPLTPHELRREQERLIAEREHRDTVRREADAKHDREQAEKRAAQERQRRERAEAEVAQVRSRVERQCRLDGVPERELKAVVDQAMREWHVERARETADHGDRLRREMRAALGLPPAGGS